ncbi:deoxycytidine triphosphate deaminase [Nostoc carneum NIES-2107]|nr:deoxycytidine triphosphate deaminase [Nostoc carneum NIES-2107]
MSILTDTDLKKILCYDEAQWNELKPLLIQHGSDECITPMGYDLRVGGFYKTFIAKPNLDTLDEGKSVEIKPGDIALIGTYEKLKMPKDGSISALILSRVSQVSRGLSNISTKVDPGWAEGELLIPVQNFSRDVIRINYKEKFCTIVFFKNESPASLYNSSSSRAKFFRLLSQTSNESLKKDFQLGFLSLFIIGMAGIIGYYYFGNSPGFGVTVTVGIALERIASVIAARLIGRR